MGLFDFFNSEYSQYKKIFDHLNHLPTTDSRRKGIEVLLSFYNGAIMMPMMFDNKLFQNKEKMDILFAYFSGAADQVSQRIKLDNDEGILFVSFFLVVMLYDGDYKTFGEVRQKYLDNMLNPVYLVIMTDGGRDIYDTLEHNKELSEVSMQLNETIKNHMSTTY